MPSDSIEKIQAKRQALADAEAEEAKTQAVVGAVTDSGNQTTDTLSKSMHDILMATMIGKDPRITEIAEKLSELLESIATASDQVRKSGLTEVKATFDKLYEELVDLPNKVAATDQSAELIPFIQRVEKAVKDIRVNPEVTVNERELDLKPLTDLLKNIEKALKSSKAGTAKQDNEELLSAIQDTTKAINSLSFPVPNFLLPFKDSTGKDVQVQINDSGSIPTYNSAAADGTSSGTITTQNLNPNSGVATAGSTVEITLGTGQNTIAIQTVGTYTGALTLQGTVNGVDWVSFAGTPLLNANTGLWLATITSALQSVFFAKVSGFSKVRISALAATTGFVVVSIGASVGDSFQGALGVLTTVTTVTTLTTLTNITNWGNLVDNAAFTDGTTRLSMNGYIYDEVAGTGLTENDGAAARINVNRAQVEAIEDGVTRGRYLTVTAANAAKVDGSAVTQPVSAASLPLPSGAATSALQTQPGVDIGDVTINNASGASAVNIQDGGNSITVDGTVSITGVSTLAEQQTQTTSLQLIDDIVYTDDTSTHATGTSKGALIMGAATPTDTAVNANDIGAIGMTNNRSMYVSVQDALPAGNNNIGDVDVLTINGVAPAFNTGVRSATTQRVTIATDDVVPVTDNGGSLTVDGSITANAGTNLNTSALALDATLAGAIKTEDAAHTTGDKGVMSLAVRNDSGSALAGTDGDYIPISTDNTGAIRVTGGGGGTQYTEDVAAAADPTGNMNIAVRQDTLSAATVSADGDNIALRSTSKGELYVKQTDAVPITDNSGSITVDNGGTFAVQATLAAGATSIGKAEDVASADADVGVPSMAVRKATPANTSGTDGDYEMLQMSAGRLWVDASGKTLTVDGSGVTQPVSLASVPSHAVTNAGTFAVQATLAAETTKVIGTVNQGTSPWVTSNATTSVVGNGAAATAQRVTLANDSTGIISLTTGTASIGKLAANSGVDIGDVDVTSVTFPTPVATSTYSPTSFQNLGANATLNVKASAGNVFSVYCNNENAADRFIQLHNTATTPAGAAVPLYTFRIPAGGDTLIGTDFFTNAGANFSTGIAFAFSTTKDTYTAGTAGDHSTIVMYK